MSSSQIVNESQLDSWARSNPALAQGKIVELVWRLVCASCPRPKHRRFPLGDSIGQHGADGELDTDVGYLPFVPEGRTHWEIGTNVDAHAKANRDYKDATESIPKEVRMETSFVFVTPLSGRRDWKDTWKEAGIETWVSDKQALKEWKNVVVLDGTQLTDWVCHFPVVGHWLGELVGRLPDDFETAESRWNIIRDFGNPPPLLPELYTTGRELAAAKLKRLLLDNSENSLRIDTRYPKHTADFVCAFVASYLEEEMVEPRSRILILQDSDSWKSACALSESHVLIADFDVDADEGTQLIQRALQRRHAVIYSGLPGGSPHGNAVELPPPRANQMRDALSKSGYSDERARTLTIRSGDDLNALLRLLQNLSAMPDWATQAESSDLAIAQFLGAWDDERSGDQAIAEELAGKEYREWIIQIRKVASAKPAPLDFYNGRWKFTSRFEPWLYLGPQIGPELLERFKKLAIAVLSEPDPALELPKDQRFAASIYGKERLYSSKLRKGMAETLALLGAQGDALKTCPTGRPQAIARDVVHELLAGADSSRWASLNDVLPLLAEASPDTFLKAVGGASEQPDEPFTGVFAEEGDGMHGGIYSTGILWALESLAWNGQFLVRVCGILANLAAVDPGGQWSNRPSASLVSILLPWFPQTCADVDRRHDAVRCVVREQPEVAWRLLVGLLPEIHSITSGTHKPKWRDWIPENWSDGVTQHQRIVDELFYAQLALELAGDDADKLGELIDYYFRLAPAFRESLRNRLTSPEILNLTDERRLKLWSILTTKIRNHRKYSESDVWSQPEDALTQLDTVANQLAPEEPDILYRRLFSGDDFNLYEESNDWEAERQKLQLKRINAIRKILEDGGFDSFMQFIRSVESPHAAGTAYGADKDLADDSRVLPVMLESDNDAEIRFASSYVWMRFRYGSWDWVDRLNRSTWSVISKSLFFSFLPFVADTWDRVSVELAERQTEYWTRVRALPDREHLDRADYAIEMLIANDRPDSAIQCLRFGNLEGGVFSQLGLQALEALNTSHHLDQHSICELFNDLHKDTAVDEGRVAAMEAKFLELLDRFSSSGPRTLHRHLAEQPRFFCEVIRMLYRSRKDPEVTKDSAEDENKANLARRAYLLLNDWTYPPGKQRDATFDAKQFQDWVQAVKSECIDSGHWEVACNEIGEVLYFGPRDTDGLWIEPICELLNSKEDEGYRRGLSIEIFNSRGVHGFSGGKDELELAETWERIAAHAESKGFSRLGETLHKLGAGYREEAKRTILEDRYDFE